MAIIFKDVTDIHTAWGNLTKIQDAATGVVLWQKKSIVVPTPEPEPDPIIIEDGYPKIVPVLNNKYAKADYFRDEAEFSKYFNTAEVGSSYKAHDGIKPSYVGDIISFPYVNTKDEEKNVFTKGHSAPVTCAFEYISPRYDSYVEYAATRQNGSPNNFRVNMHLPDFCTIEKKSENSISITSIKNNSEYGSYLSSLESELSSSYPKANYPYFCLRMMIPYYSSSLGISYEIDNYIYFYYYITR